MGGGGLGAADRIFDLRGGVVFKEREPVAAVLQATPKYMLLGGVIGALITYTVVKSMESWDRPRRQS